MTLACLQPRQKQTSLKCRSLLLDIAARASGRRFVRSKFALLVLHSAGGTDVRARTLNESSLPLRGWMFVCVIYLCSHSRSLCFS